MDKARAAIANFTSKHGHTTDVEEQVRPAVTSEQIKPHRHEEVTQAVDREVHQHHHHTTVQPLQHREVLPEVHQHTMIPVEHREFRHDNEEETRMRLEREAAQFRDSSIVHETHVTQAAAPTVTGEHVHHHVHETVQPIVHKETIKPEIVHTTVPIHETHLSSTKHHGMSTLPMKTLEEFTSAGGALTGGRSVTHEHYEGQPRPYNKDLQTRIEDVLPGHHGERGVDSGVGGVGTTGTGMNTTTGPHNSRLANELDPRVDSNLDGRSGLGQTTGPGHTNRFTGSSTAGPHNSNIENKLDPRVDSNLDGRSGLGNTGNTAYGSNTGYGNTSSTTGTGYGNTGSALTGDRTTGTTGSGYGNTGSGLTGDRTTGTTGSGYGNTGSGLTGDRTTGTTGSGLAGDNTTNTTGTTTKPSMMDRLNPFKDTAGDGRRGINE